MADSNYVLVEFMPSVPYSEICTAVRNLSRAGYTPVVAHAERYRCLRKGKRVEELIDLEALIQMNYRSVSGGWHDATARWCKDNLKKGISILWELICTISGAECLIQKSQWVG